MSGSKWTEIEHVDLEQYPEWCIGFWVALLVGRGPPRKGKVTESQRQELHFEHQLETL